MEMRNKYFRWVLAVMLIFTVLLPVGDAFASGGGYFTNYSLTSDLSSPISASSSSPTIVYKSTVSISAIYNNINPNTVTFTVTQKSTGNVITSQTQKPTVDTTRSELTFNTVSLMPGVNVIQLSGTDAVTGAVDTGNPIYIQFNNSPTISNTTLVTNTTTTTMSETSPTIVQTSPVYVTFDVSNATSATVNGVPAFGSSTHYSSSKIPLNPGDNTITIVATGDGGTITKNYTVVYFNGVFGVYGALVGPSGGQQSPIYQSTTANVSFPGSTTTESFSGNLIVPHLSTAPTYVRLTDPSNSSTSFGLTTTLVSSSVSGDVYNFTASLSGIDTKGTYQLVFNNTSNVTDTSTDMGSVSFNYQPSDATYISGVYELQSQTGPTLATINPNATYAINQIPLWLGIKVTNDPNAANPNGASPATELQVVDTSSGKILGDATASYDSSLGMYTVNVNSLQAGTSNLTLKLIEGSNTTTQQITVSNSNSPSIQILNYGDGQKFSNNDVQAAIQFQTNNIPSGTTIQATLNGNPLTVASASGQNMYTAYFSSLGNQIQLLPGQNIINITATVGNATVSTSITLFYMSNILPQLTVNTPTAGTLPGNPVIAQVTNGEYATTDTSVILSGTMKNVDKLDIYTNGNLLTTITYDATAPTGYDYDSTYVSSITLSAGVYTFTLTPQALQTTGSTIFDFEASGNGNTQSIKVQIDKTVSPYSILSPNLTNNKGIINQNFLPVVIQAVGADSVVINKLPAVQLSSDTFAVELEGLKSGTNTISFVVNRGTAKTTGKFTVNYLNQNTTGAKFKSQLATGGKFTAFNNALSIVYPKNTFMQQPNNNPGGQSSISNLDDSRYLLAGIADSSTGSIEDSFQNNSVTSIGIDIFRDPSDADHYVPAGNTYWIDAGFPGQTSYNGFTPVGGIDPLPPVGDSWNTWPTNNLNYTSFYERDYGEWMQPTNSGKVTLQYNPDVRNAVQTQLTVFYLGQPADTSSSTAWVNLGGVVNTSNHTITVPFAGFGYYKVALENASFPDIETHPWAKIALNTMYAKGIMLPKDSSHFSTDLNISRGEFATLLVKALNIPLNYDQNNTAFDDVFTYYRFANNYLFDYRYIETAARRGIVKGEGPRWFGPNDDLTREQAAVMIAQALNYKLSLDPSTGQSALAKAFTDSGTIDYYAIPSVLAVTKAKIMNGKPVDPTAKKPTYYFDPKAPLSRAEAASIAMKMMQSIKLLPTTT